MNVIRVRSSVLISVHMVGYLLGMVTFAFEHSLGIILLIGIGGILYISLLTAYAERLSRKETVEETKTREQS